jgi:Uma2 family endonuclease
MRGIWRTAAILRSMSLPAASEILDATEHLPEGAALVVPQVTWDDYERLLAELAERPHLRVSYDCGRLEIVSPLPEHEKYARFFDDLVRAYADVYDMELEKLGQTTWKRKALGKGVEADACYYVRNAARIIGKRLIDLESDPPPDIVVEIDTTSTSLNKFPIYAALAVPEIWRYDGENVHIYELTEGRHLPVSESRVFPRLTGPILAEPIGMSKTLGQKTALEVFRKRLRSHKE